MQKSSVVVVADKTSLKRPFIFANAVHMALCFFMLKMTVIWHGDLLQTGKMVPSIPVAMMYAIEIGCLLLSALGLFGACKGKRWCLILYAAGMAAVSQTIIIRTALSYQDVYEKRVVRDESRLLAMMPLSGPSKGNRTLLHNIQEEFECCGLIEGYKDWGSSIPASCNCHYPGKCIRLRSSVTLGAPKNQYVYREIDIKRIISGEKKSSGSSWWSYSHPFKSIPPDEKEQIKAQSFVSQPCLPIYVSELKLAFFLVMAIQFGSAVFWIILLVMSIKLMGQVKKKQEFIALLQSNRYVPGAF